METIWDSAVKKNGISLKAGKDKRWTNSVMRKGRCSVKRDSDFYLFKNE